MKPIKKILFILVLCLGLFSLNVSAAFNLACNYADNATVSEGDNILCTWDTVWYGLRAGTDSTCTGVSGQLTWAGSLDWTVGNRDPDYLNYPYLCLMNQGGWEREAYWYWSDAPPIPPLPDYYNVTVSVHGTGGNPVNGATVELHRNDNFSSVNSALSDSNGNVTFSSVPYTAAPEVRVFATGYQYWGEVFDPYTSEILVDVYLQGTGLTPTPTPTPAGPQAGYVRTSVHVWDRSGNGLHGANIDIKDLFNGTWSNSTHDADGIFYIDTLPYAHIDIYGSFDIFANEFLPNSLLNQDTGPGGYVYFLTLFPYESGASPGNVSLYVEVKEADTGHYIPYANVQIVLSNGNSYAGSTANAGSKVFLVPNNTIVRATGTAPGYLPATVIANSGEAGSMTMTINLLRQTVTTRPTSTVPPGGVTPAVTVDPNDPALHGGDTSLKGQEMMIWLANHGMDLVQLCFFVTILALLGFKFGK